MIGSKFMFTFIGIILAIFALLNLNFSTPVVEGFWGGIQLGTTVQSSAKLPSGEKVAIGGNFLNTSALGSNKFVSVPSYQAMLSPRFSNLNYGADIKYNMPDRVNMASPCDPLTFGDMANEKFMMNKRENFIPKTVQRENYEGGCANCGSGSCGGGCSPSCGKGAVGLGHKFAMGYELPPDVHAPGNWNQIHDSLPGDTITNELPVGTMATVNGAGESEQVVVYNNLMFAPRPTSRAFAQSDFFRGDLAIVPCQSGWFSVYPNIATDINPGAMKVMNGEGDSNNATLSLLASSSGRNTFGGVNLAETATPYSANMAMQSQTKLSAGLNDITVSAFP